VAVSFRLVIDGADPGRLSRFQPAALGEAAGSEAGGQNSYSLPRIARQG